MLTAKDSPKLIVGLGNPILGDDGVGWRIAEEVSRRSGIPLGDAALGGKITQGVSIECYALAGLSLMERLIGYHQVILIDSLNTGLHRQGDIVRFTLADMDDLTCGHSASAHDVSLKQALHLGRTMNEVLPEDAQVHVVAVEARHVYDFGEDLSPEIAAAVPLAAHMVLDLLARLQGEGPN